MPITQDRMLALIGAAQTLKTKLESIRQITSAHTTQLYSSGGEPTPADTLIAEILSITEIDYRAAEVIMAEAVHFKHTKGRNARYAARARIVRGKAQEGDTVVASGGRTGALYVDLAGEIVPHPRRTHTPQIVEEFILDESDILPEGTIPVPGFLKEGG